MTGLHTTASDHFAMTMEAARGEVRRMHHGDVAAVAALRRRVFRRSELRSPQAMVEYVQQLFLPEDEPDAPASLVFESERGDVLGFVGVLSVSMVFRSAPIRAVRATQLMAAPGGGALIGRRLARALISGPYDLIVADTANTAARLIWRSVGGRTSLTRSLTWRLPTPPGRTLCTTLASRERGWRTTARLLRGAAWLTDRSWRRRSDLRVAHEAGDRLQPVDAPSELVLIDAVLDGRSVRPSYTAERLELMLRGLLAKRECSHLDQLAAFDHRGAPLGFLILSVDRQRVAEVVVMACRPGATARVLALLHDHTCASAYADVRGRVDPVQLPELLDAGVSLTHDGPWTLFHSHQPEIAAAVDSGDAFLSRLEGEWWLNF